VTAAFLQVLHTLHVAESCRIGDKRNILHVSIARHAREFAGGALPVQQLRSCVQ